MKSPTDMVVLGDIDLDWSVAGVLPQAFSNTSGNLDHWAAIEERPGGSGLLFADRAREAGYRPLLLGKVGDDVAGRFLSDWLQTRGIEAAIEVENARPTGMGVLVFDQQGHRLMVNRLDNANRLLAPADIEKFREEINSCQVLYVSGYCLKEKDSPQKEAARRAIELATGSRGSTTPCVVIDVVPHAIYQSYSYDEYKRQIQGTDILVSAVSTMRRFLGWGHCAETVTEEMAVETAEALKPAFGGLILRYGTGGCSKQLLWDVRTGRLEIQHTDFEEAEVKIGYGDHLTIQALRGFFGI